jgi:hypothetical protein
MGMMNRMTIAAGALTFAVLTASQARAQAVITNGKIALGVNAGGALNIACSSGAPGTEITARCLGGGNGVGVLNTLTNHESTYDGCTCEGWGAGVSGGANNGLWDGQNTSSGPTTPTGAVTFTSTATTATSTVDVGGMFTITQFYHPSAVLDLYQVDVTITNTSGADLGVGADGIRYRREMDWDIEPTAFDEYSTLHGVGATGLLHSSDNGFVSSNPFLALTDDGCAPTSTLDVDFYHSGPCDHGAAFDFGFPALAAGASQSFSIFYGAADNEATALADLGAVSADDVYSFGQSDSCPRGDDACVAREETFIFGFKGIKGATTLGTPEPASIALMGTGLVGLAGFARRRRGAKQA